MSWSEADEAGFVARLRAHDEQAFNELVRTYERRVFGLVLRMLNSREEAEDLAQEVFVQIFKAIDQFRGDSKLSTWIYRIAINLCKNRSKYLQGTTAGSIARPDDMLVGMQVERVVQHAISQLEPDFREALILRDVEDLSYEEIGQITGSPDGTVKSRIHRARAQLRALIEQELGERLG